MVVKKTSGGSCGGRKRMRQGGGIGPKLGVDMKKDIVDVPNPKRPEPEGAAHRPKVTTRGAKKKAAKKK